MKQNTYTPKTDAFVFRLVLSGIFLAMALLLPFLTGQVPEIGAQLCPMHIPVLLCGFICGAKYGFAVGAIAPLLRSLTFGMPPLFPTATAMAFELAAYGALAGIMYLVLDRIIGKNAGVAVRIGSIYASLITAMLGGRLVWGAVKFVIAGLQNTSFTFGMFYTAVVVQSVAGIILQLVLIPPLVFLLDGMMKKYGK